MHCHHRLLTCAQVFEAADETLKEEDAVKERLCSELNMLVQQSAHAQLEKLDEVQHCSAHFCRLGCLDCNGCLGVQIRSLAKYAHARNMPASAACCQPLLGLIMPSQ